MLKEYSLSYSTPMISQELSEYIIDSFGVSLDQHPQQIIFEGIKVELSAPLTYIYGISGAGKSKLLHAIMKDLPCSSLLPTVKRDTVPIIDLFDIPRDEAIKYLVTVGLGEVFLFIRSYQQLSDGQKYRLRLALALSFSPKILIIDDFLENVDRDTAKAIAMTFSSQCKKKGIQIFLASVDSDLVDYLQPNQLIVFNFTGTKTIKIDNPISLPFHKTITICDGDNSSIIGLKQYHYLTDFDYPAEDYHPRVKHIIFNQSIIGAAIYTLPYPVQWEEEELFARLNANIEINSFLVIHPNFRGQGLGSYLLKSKQKKYTYIRSAMFAYNPLPLNMGFIQLNLITESLLNLEKRINAIYARKGITNITTLHNINIREQFIKTIPNNDKSNLRGLLMEKYVYQAIIEYKTLHYKIYGINITDKEEQLLTEYFNYLFEDYSLNFLITETIPFKMGYYLG